MEFTVLPWGHASFIPEHRSEIALGAEIKKLTDITE